MAAGSLSIELDPFMTRIVLDPLACRATIVPEPIVINEPRRSVWPAMIYSRTELAAITEVPIMMGGGVITGWAVTAFDVALGAEVVIVLLGL